jgi:hypothetical protein
MQIRKLPQINVNSSQAEIIKAMKDCEVQRIENVNWPEFSYKPDVSFRIAHNRDVIFLSYKVVEDNPRAVYVNDFEPVYKDSCVEFFISPGESLHYYNFEFNCIGTALMAYIWSEDLNEGQVYNGVRVINPLISSEPTSMTP